MASRHVVLRKKLEELEAEVDGVLQSPTELPFRQLISDGIRRKIGFVKTLLTAEMESHSRDKPQHLDQMADRLSIIEDTFVNWANSGADEGPTDGPVSPCSCTSSCFNEEGEEEDQEGTREGEEEQEDPENILEGEGGESKTVISNVTAERIREEVDALLSEVNLETILSEFSEKLNRRERRRGGWFRKFAAMGAAVVLTVGLVIASFDVVDETIYLVPT